MATPQEASTVIEQVREALQDEGDVREVRMFGGTAFMVDDAMVVSVGKGDDLLVRVDPAGYDGLITRPGAHPAVMGERPMGPSWIRVEPTDTDDLAFWIETALEHRRAT